MLGLNSDRLESILEKRRKCQFPTFSSPFPTMFSKGFFPRVVKSCHHMVQSQYLSMKLNKNFSKISIWQDKGTEVYKKTRDVMF